MAWDDCLTKEQKIVTKYIDTDACLLAGPGTGKTRCITQRVVYLNEELEVPLQNILVLTFTRKAAAELRSRVTKAFGTSIGLNLFTLHSYALTELLKNSQAHSLPKPLRIADDYEEKEIIDKDLLKMLTYTRDQVNKAKKNMSSDWEELGDGDPERNSDPRFIAAWNMHRKVFGYTLRSELVFQLNKAIEEHSIIPESYDHIIVDEYQDLNACELNVIKSLASRGAKLYVAGDDDQSIYWFRNANPEGIRNFTKDYPGSVFLPLLECKRSTPQILKMGNHVINHDLARIDKKTFTNKESVPNSVKILRFPNQIVEAKKISKLCSWLVRDKKVDPKEIIILLRYDRFNIFSKPIIKELSTLGIDVSESSNTAELFNNPTSEPPNQRKLGRILFSYLRLINNIEDHLAWRAILFLSDNGIGNETISRITNYARINGKSFYETLKLIQNGTLSLTSFDRKISEEVNSIEQLVLRYREDFSIPVEGLINNLASEIILDETFRNRLIEPLILYLDQGENTKLGSLLTNVFLEDPSGSQDQPENKIRIMTIHQAKGLDAKNVIVIGAENELIPGKDSDTNLNNALRLLYVSVTRAQDFLYITHCSYRNGPQCHSGTGEEGRSRQLTTFISGGPFKDDNGADFIDSLVLT